MQHQEERQYFLGIGGEQTGPFNAKEMEAKIRAALIPADALYWYDGLEEWQPITAAFEFRDCFEAAARPAVPDGALDLPGTVRRAPKSDTLRVVQGVRAKPAAPNQPAARPSRPQSSQTSFAAVGDDLSPIFKDDDLEAPRTYVRKRVSLFIGMFFVVAGGAGTYFFFSAEMSDLPKVAIKGSKFPHRGVAGAPKASSKPATEAAAASPTPVTTLTPEESEARRTTLQTAQSELLVKPDATLATLGKLIADYPSDAVAASAVETAVGYYRTNQRFADAARLMLVAKRPLEAAKLFLVDPPSYQEAEHALYTAYQDPKTADRRAVLVQDIELLIGPLRDSELGVRRIRLLEKDFSNQAHPFAFYLKSTNEKIHDLFSRLSFHFVQSLLAFLQTEFPQVSLVKRPVVEVTRDRGGRYRIVGRYVGDILLNRDQMNDISFTFWLQGDAWSLVDTDMTEDRRKFAVREKERLADKALSDKEMLDFLQQVFHLKFPRNAFHDKVVGGTAPE